MLSSVADNVAAKIAPKFVEPFKIQYVRGANVYSLINRGGRLAGNAHAKNLNSYVMTLENNRGRGQFQPGVHEDKEGPVRWMYYCFR
ncbi:hypothetical protein J6590_060873 [Homalodisca vitripennis]|nr:hypothetical protein J6590_060873 [Homalodisca vitripennis]